MTDIIELSGDKVDLSGDEIDLSWGGFTEEDYDYTWCFTDADSIFYRIAATTESCTVARSTFDGAIKDIMRKTNSQHGMVAVKEDFQDTNNFRYKIAEDYKGNRSRGDTDPGFKERLFDLYQYSWDTGCFRSKGCEADDVVCIWAEEAEARGESWIIAHIDKDIDQYPGDHYNYKKQTIYQTSPAEAHRLLCRQLLTGDSSDNIKGLYRVGPKTADKLLDGVPEGGMLEVVRREWRSRHPQEWEQMLQKCFNLIYMRRNWDEFREMTIEEVFGGSITSVGARR